MMAGPRRFQPRISVRSGAAARVAAGATASVSTAPAPAPTLAEPWSSASITSRSPARIASDGGGQSCARPSRTSPAGMPPVTRATASPKVEPGQLREVGEVKLVAREVQQVEVDRGQARLAARLGDDPRDEVVGQEQVDLVPGDRAARWRRSPGRGPRPRCGTAPDAGPAGR